MAGNFKVGMTLTARDDASLKLIKGLKLTQKAAEDAAKANRKSAQEQQRSDDDSIRSTKRVVNELQRAARARETLGIRSEREIRREIALTEASYNRLARSGMMSAREQERAWRATKEQIRELKREMRGVGTLAKAANFGSNALTIGGGIAAGAAVMAQPVKQQMSYERQIAMMANTAFSDGGLEGRRSGLERMKNSIRNAVTYGGGTKEDAAETLDALLKENVSFETANKWLPDLMKYATASGASALDLAKIAIKGKQVFGFSDADIPTVLNMAIAAGKAGGFELSDMARWLPAQMAAAQAAGMKGKDDFARMLALNEVANITAGSTDEAGNNVVNLLAKLTSHDIETAAKGIDLNGKGIDLPGTLTEARERGLAPIETLSLVIDKIAAKDARYTDLQKKLASTTDKGEKAAIYESMTKILEGFAVGKLVADRQALMALVAYRNNPEYRKRVEDAVNQQRTLPEGQRAGDVDFKFISDTNDFKAEQAKNALEFARMESVTKLADATGITADLITKAGKEFPTLTTAVVGATTAIEAMTAAAVAFAGLKVLSDLSGLRNRGPGGRHSPDIPDKGKKGRWGRVISAGGQALASLFGYYEAEEFLTSAVDDETRNTLDNYGLFFSSDGSMHLTREGMNKRERELKDAENGLPSPEQVSSQSGMTSTGNSRTSDTVTSQNQQPAAPLNVTTQLVLDGQVVAEAVNRYNLQDGNRGTGGTY